MFVTNIHYEFPQVGPIDPLNHRFWTGIEMGPQLPWFHATFHLRIGKKSATRFLLCASIEELARARLTRSAQSELKSVLLVSPPWLNRGPHWRMDSLSEIVVAEGQRREEVARFYRLENGETWSEGSTAIDSSAPTRQLFPFDP